MISGSLGVTSSADESIIDGEHRLCFIELRELPELYTISVSPSNLDRTKAKASFHQEHRRLSIKLKGFGTTNFIFQEPDVMVLSPLPFQLAKFREALRAAILEEIQSIQNNSSSPMFPIA